MIKRRIYVVLFILMMTESAYSQLMNAKSFVGQVSALKGDAVTLKQDEVTLVLTVTHETRIIQDEEFKGVEDIRVGDKVVAVYRERGNRNIAVVITLSAKK